MLSLALWIGHSLPRMQGIASACQNKDTAACWTQVDIQESNAAGLRPPSCPHPATYSDRLANLHHHTSVSKHSTCSIG